MQELFADVTPLELVEFGWDVEATYHPERYVRPLLSCGHYGRPVFECSSQWDFPHDEHICPICGAVVQWDVRVQAAVAGAT